MTDQRAFVVRLAPDLDDRLKLAALITGQTNAAIIRAAVEAHLGELERTTAYKQRRAEILVATTPVGDGKRKRGQQ